MAGGAERQLVELVKGLSQSKEYEIHIASLMRSDTGYDHIIDSLGVPLEYFPRRWKYDLLGPLLALVSYIRTRNIALVHGFMNMGSLFASLAAKITRRPVVCSAIRDAKNTSLREKYLKYMLAVLSDMYVSNSRAGFANRFKKMKPHFRVVYNGIDLSRFHVEPEQVEAVRKELKLTASDPVVGMVGSLSDYKDHKTFLAAAPAVLRAFPSSKFLIVGDGPKRAALLELAKSLHIHNAVILAGHRKDVEHIYPLMQVCVLLTNTRVILEGIPNVLMEAMACGVPVVASWGGGTSELVIHGETGLLVPPHDPEETAKAILCLLTHTEERTRMGKRAREEVSSRFSLPRYVGDYKRIYRDLLKQAGG